MLIESVVLFAVSRRLPQTRGIERSRAKKYREVSKKKPSILMFRSISMRKEKRFGHADAKSYVCWKPDTVFRASWNIEKRQ